MRPTSSDSLPIRSRTSRARPARATSFPGRRRCLQLRRRRPRYRGRGSSCSSAVSRAVPCCTLRRRRRHCHRRPRFSRRRVQPDTPSVPERYVPRPPRGRQHCQSLRPANDDVNFVNLTTKNRQTLQASSVPRRKDSPADRCEARSRAWHWQAGPKMKRRFAAQSSLALHRTPSQHHDALDATLSVFV